MTIELSLQNRLVGHWTFDSSDTSEGNIYDSSGHQNHGALNGVNIGFSSILGKSYDFSGTSPSYVNIPQVTELAPTKTITVALWVNPDIQNSRATYILTGRDVNSGVEFRNGEMQVICESGQFSTGININNNEWTHLCLTYESGIGGNAYVNGSNISSTGDIGDIVYPQFYDNAPTIGSHGGDLYEFNGQISDVRIYNRALSQIDVIQLYNMRSQRHASI